MSKLTQSSQTGHLSVIVEKVALLSLGVALPIVCGGLIIAGPLINVAYGHEYIDAVLTFQILLLALLVSFPGTAFADVLFAENKQKVFITASIIGAVLNVGLDLLLIPRYGIAGSAVATLVTQIAINAVFFVTVRKYHRIHIFHGMRNMLLATIGMTFVAYLMKTHALSLVSIVFVSAITYVGILLVLKEPLLTDIRQSLRV